MENKSGIRPVEFNVLIQQDEVKKSTAGGLHLPVETVEREKFAQTLGVIVAMSPMAFNQDVWPGDIPRPEAGQRVVFAKHSGTFVNGTDGEEYRMIKDKDVVGLIDG